MDSTVSTITPSPLRRRSMYGRGLFHQVKAVNFLLLLSCTLFAISTYELGTPNGMQKPKEFGAGDQGMGFQDIVFGDASCSDIRSPITHVNIEAVCANSDSFCFPSTLPGFSNRGQKFEDGGLEVSRHQYDSIRKTSNNSWLSDSGIFGLLNGHTVSCFLNFQGDTDGLLRIQTDPMNRYVHSLFRHLLKNQRDTLILKENLKMMQSSSFGPSPSPHVQISPPVLDWGEKHLYFPSVAFLTVENTHNDSILHVYEPFSTNLQFYPCNFSEILLGPGEIASICFVYLPRWLGLSSTHLILQTSAGGFLVQIKGYAVESPYQISPLVISTVPSNGQLSKNLSLFNPFDEALHVKEASAWILFSLGNNSYHTEAICRRENIENSNELRLLTINDWLVVKNGQVGPPLVSMRAHENWEIGPKSTGTVLEIDFSYVPKGRLVGAFCMQLLRSSQEKPDELMIPVEVELEKSMTYGGVAGSLSISLEALMPCNANGTAFVVISLRNREPHVLKVIEITEVAETKVFQVKYVEGLLLFPASITKAATIPCNQLLAELHDSLTEISSIIKNCKLVVLTNYSSSAQIKIPCQDLIHVCLGAQQDSAVRYVHRPEYSAISNRGPGALDNSIQMSSTNKVRETAEADEFILESWKSQGTPSGMSVLDDQELLFPMVEIGSHGSKWIIVKNPSQKPVAVQLILHSGEILEDCRTDGIMQPSFPCRLLRTELNASTRYGFLMGKGSLTEAIVHPYGEAKLGPVFFHPSKRCGWRSSALIRNNLSGVEWLPLRGYGGSPSLLLLEGSVPVQRIELNLKFAIPDDFSHLELLFHLKEVSYACFQPLSKELHVKNIGDLPLVVRRIEISGTRCNLDGFSVHPCIGFSLEPSESMTLLISYKADFSAPMVQRDLGLALSSGVLVIPMKASLPFHRFNLCRKSIFWLWLKKISAALVLCASFIFLIRYFIFFQVIALGSQSYSYKNTKCSGNTIRSSGKSSGMQQKQKNIELPSSTEIDNLFRSGEEDKSLKQDAVYLRDQDGMVEHYMFGQNATATTGNHKQMGNLVYKDKDETILSTPTKSGTDKNYVSDDAAQSCNLTVRVGKEKGRRRRKSKAVNAGLTGLFEVSSSQSGNSTPSSPLPPATFLASNATLLASPDMETIKVSSPHSQVISQQCKKVQFSESASREFVSNSNISCKYCNKSCFSSTVDQALAPGRSSSKHLQLPSATYPSAGSTASNKLPSSLGTCSTIVPYSRAPGPKVYNQRADNLERKAGDKYTYDIWGHHLSGLHLMDSSRDVSAMKTITLNNSNSFFVSSPQALVTKSQPEYANYFQPEG
ncbi:hypothetical protein K2173_021286 [Erythroxylum novogranatense]|uniref:Transmembrane protein 131-like N-terminal domain-containing protein n=1 Tax=Erythroxylum novogranatense TaxID=1862640 RepID=A0AAV8TXN5_9ROSI|nr:hypothetical protein K2173_021286 [Erythroxylum novogranatense]